MALWPDDEEEDTNGEILDDETQHETYDVVESDLTLSLIEDIV